MNVAIIGRTAPLIEAAKLIAAKGHSIKLVWACGEAVYHGAGPDEFAQLANEHGARFVNSAKINSAFDDAEGCALAVSLGWPTRIGKRVIEAFPKGVINGHAGDLPRYRGTAGPNWAILNGEPHIGLCVHSMGTEYDDGPVWVRRRFPLRPHTYVGEFYDWMMKDNVPGMLADAVEKIAHNEHPEAPSTAPSLYCYPRQPSDSEIRWSDPVDKIYRLIRASSKPFGGAHTLFMQRRVIVWRAIPVQHPGEWCAMPGTVCYAIDSDPVIACGDGMLRLLDLDAGFEANQAALKKFLASSKRNRLGQ